MDPIFLESADGFRRCPYNPQHVIASVRFIGHLMKCSKSSGKKFQVCPWNAQHHIVEPVDYEAHLSTCICRTYVDIKPPKIYPNPAVAVAPLEHARGESPTKDIAPRQYCDIKIVDLSENSTLGRMPAKNNFPDMTESNEKHLHGKMGIYGNIEEVHQGIAAIVDAFSASSFSKSANGLEILQKLVDTIYEEAEIMAD